MLPNERGTERKKPEAEIGVTPDDSQKFRDCLIAAYGQVGG